jgi:hypothetical protein
MDKKIQIIAVIIGVLVPLTAIAYFASVLPEDRLAYQSQGDQISAEGSLTPMQVLSNKNSYNAKKIAIQGKVAMDQVVCNKVDCPSSDRCCGCPSSKNVFLKNTDNSVQTSTVGALNLLNSDGKAACTRIVGSCNYDCGDWEDGAIYNVTGTFHADPPPPGWMLSLDFYFLTDSKALVGHISSFQTVSGFLKGTWDYLKSFTNSGQYVLQ